MTPPPALLLSAALLLLLLPATLSNNQTSFKLMVRNLISGTEQKVYDTDVPSRGILIGAMRRLNTTENFKFTYSENPDYGPYLESVNGVAGNTDDRTFWELLVKLENGTFVQTDVGIGCFIPKLNDQVMLNFTRRPV
ncbi:unnamed protein product [Ophioblennius macclurei]